MSYHEYVAEEFQVGDLTVKVIQDSDPMNPRKEFDHVGTMVCWHRRYDLGDEQRTDSPSDFFDELVTEIHPNLVDYLENGLWNKHVTEFVYGQKFDEERYKAQKAAYREERREIVQKVLNKHYVMLPLGLYDHSGISMYVGSQPHWSDPGGWDSGQVGWIYCTMKKAQEEWGSEKAHKHYGVLGDPDAVRKCAEKYLKGEVEEYDQYLTGDVYGYVVEDEDEEQLDSCWGFFGLKYATEEAKSAAEYQWNKVVEQRAEQHAREYHAQLWEQRMMAV